MLLPRAKGLLRYAQVFSDFQSIQSFRRLMNDPRHGAAGGPVPLRLRALHGNTIWCRPRTSDVNVIYDTFFEEYHLPPPGVEQPSTILDLGSNIGTTIAHYAALFPDARILGVEIDEGNVETCRRNIAAYADRAAVLWGAAWSDDGMIGYGGDSEWGFRVVEKSTKVVRAYSMDSLIGKLGGRVDFVKMDIEGAEADIFRKSVSWVERVRSLKVEIHEPYSVEQCLEDLAQADIRCEVDTKHHSSVIGLAA